MQTSGVRKKSHNFIYTITRWNYIQCEGLRISREGRETGPKNTLHALALHSFVRCRVSTPHHIARLQGKQVRKQVQGIEVTQQSSKEAHWTTILNSGLGKECNQTDPWQVVDYTRCVGQGREPRWAQPTQTEEKQEKERQKQHVAWKLGQTWRLWL